MSLIAVIGRGHSGTRTMAHTLYASGVYMGRTLNPSGDKVPPHALYEACRVMARYVRWNGGLSWDFAPLHTVDIDPEFTRLVEEYLDDVLNHKGEHRGWKLPETTLIYPWIVRLFPEARFVYWIRNPRDSIVGEHITDDLGDFGVAYPETEDERRRRAISWKYQYDIVRATPRPEHFMAVRFEDAILKQEETLARLEQFLGIPLARVVVRPDSVGRWKTDRGDNWFPFFAEAMEEAGYAAR